MRRRPDVTLTQLRYFVKAATYSSHDQGRRRVAHRTVRGLGRYQPARAADSAPSCSFGSGRAAWH